MTAMDTKPAVNIPLLLNTVLAGLNTLSAKELAQIGVTTQSARALVVLLHHAELRCSRLSRLLGLEATALSHLLRALARKHLIIRNRVENDNRAVEVRLSDKGRRVAQACQTATRGYERTLLTGLEADELLLLQRVLTKMNDNIAPLTRRPRDSGGPQKTERQVPRASRSPARKRPTAAARARAAS
jgi:DNA-binding MarR family transcriptional regulator